MEIPAGQTPSMAGASAVTVVAVLVFALGVAAAWRQGGFWPAEALTIALLSLGLLVAGCVVAPPDRRGGVLLAGLVLFATWWFGRAVVAGSGRQALPLGAAALAFAAAFAALRALPRTARQTAGLGLACLGGAVAFVGLVGLAGRWYPMAMPSQGLWRLSSTLTYADATGVFLAVCVLVALGCDRHPALVRLALCLGVGGLVATQSRGAAVALACGLLLVPRARLTRSLVPALCGVGVGVVAVATSPGKDVQPWLAVALMVGVVVSLSSATAAACVRWARRTRRRRVVLAVAGLLTLVVVALLARHEIGVRALAPSDHDRLAEWSAAFHQWASAPLFGVGPDRVLSVHATDGTVAHFVHNEYLQVGADSGVLGLALLVCVALALARALRRVDVLSSCALGALCCLAVAGAVDFDWHLPVVGLVGGWCAGLAAQAPRASASGPGSAAATCSATSAGASPPRAAPRRSRSPR